jgi:hypothetical protein
MSVKKWISDAVLQAQVDRSGAEYPAHSDLDSETKVVTHPGTPSQTPLPKTKRKKKARNETREKKKKKYAKRKKNLFTYTPKD